MINLSNHPTHMWPAEMIQAAIAEDGQTEIPWWPFPHVDPEWSTERIDAEASAAVASIVAWVEEDAKARGRPRWETHRVVYVDGETVMAAVLAAKLQEAGFECVVARAPRLATQNPDGSTTYHFEFRGWRRWPRLEIKGWW